MSKKHLLLAVLIFSASTFQQTIAANNISSIIEPDAGPYNDLLFVALDSIPGTYISLGDHWPAAAAAEVASATSNLSTSIVTQSGATCPPRLIPSGNCARMYNMDITVTPIPYGTSNLVYSILFLSKEAVGYTTNWTGINLTGNGTGFFSTQNGDVAATATAAMASGRPVTYTTKCMYFLINGSMSQVCGWLDHLTVN